MLVAATATVSCGTKDEEPGLDEPAREGLAIDVAGVDYNVFLTRQLNTEIPPDKAYYEGEPAPPGSALYGVFLQACNPGDDPVRTATTFKVEDNQGNEFEPIELPENNAFAYRAQELGKDDCIPEDGRLPSLAPPPGRCCCTTSPWRTPRTGRSS